MDNYGKKPGKSNTAPAVLTERLISDSPPEDTPPAVWPGNDVDWEGER